MSLWQMWADSIGLGQSYVVHTFKLEYLLGQSWSNFMCSMVGLGRRGGWQNNVFEQMKLVSIATESSHIMGKMFSRAIACLFFVESSSNLQVSRTDIKSQLGLIYGQIGWTTLKLCPLENWKICPSTADYIEVRIHHPFALHLHFVCG